MSILELSKEALRERLVANAFPRFEALSYAMKTIGFVQADPIRSPARAQDLMLRQRIVGYQAGDLERAFPELGIEEGFIFAYGFMTNELWRLIRNCSGLRLGKRERRVMEGVAELGEAHPAELSERLGKRSVTNAWGGKSQETKQLLERLHHYGYLRVCRRANGIRIYQTTTENLEPEGLTERERFEALLLQTLRVFGPASSRFLLSEMRSHFHLMEDRADRATLLRKLVEEGKVSRLRVEEKEFLWIESDWPEGEWEQQLRILAPFDPLVRDRERFEQLWGWLYRFEAYVPKSKRIRGYYAMPVLWGVEMVGWANVQVREGKLYLELGFAGKRPRARAFRLALEAEAESMAQFLGLGSGNFEIR